ncbi:MAG: CPBP family intramembrane glutamic endopeptidase [Gemmatimonadales bacterium]
MATLWFPRGGVAPGVTLGAAGRGRPAEWLILVATGALLVFHYLGRADTVGAYSFTRGWFPLTLRPLSPNAHFAFSGLVLGALPVLAARLLTGAPLRTLGLGLGRWRMGLAWLAVGFPLAVLAGRIGAAAPAIRAVYPLDPALIPELERLIPHAAAQLLYFGAWEMLFRGVLLFGLRERLGTLPANLLQTAISVTAHFGRPFDEALSAVPAGLLFGWIDLRVGSVWYLAVIHWVVGVSLDYFILTTP